jgi:hypothetical protein
MTTIIPMYSKPQITFTGRATDSRAEVVSELVKLLQQLNPSDADADVEIFNWLRAVHNYFEDLSLSRLYNLPELTHSLALTGSEVQLLAGILRSGGVAELQDREEFVSLWAKVRGVTDPA